MDLVTIGIDTHKRSHSAVAVDQAGQRLAERTVPATPAGHMEPVRWAAPFVDRRCAVEDLHELLPGSEPAPRGLGRTVVLETLEAQLATTTGPVARLARELVVDILAASERINRLEREIAGLIERFAPSLLDLVGCGPLTAAKLIGETAGVRRFRHRAAFPRHIGTTPLPVRSGNQVRHRLSRGGNRQINAALHRIAVIQLQRPRAGQDYMAKRRLAGGTKTEAIRALRRRLSDEVYRRLLFDERARSPQPAGLVAAA